MGKEEFTYWMALAHLEKVHKRRKNEIVVACFQRNKTIVDFFEATEQEWIGEYNLSNEEISCFAKVRTKLANYSFQAEDLSEQGYYLIPITSKDYPRQLKTNLKYDAPVLLYVKGNIMLLNQESTAIVGSRNANPASLAFTDEMAKLAVDNKRVVVSGYAKGVDKQALSSALKYGGSSIIVLPQGITTFSSGFKSLHREIVSGSLLVMSIFRPDAPWNVSLAMARNPIIYAMADSIYVAESGDKGGTYAGAVNGLKRGRTIYVRYPEDGEQNANMQLFEEGAVLVDSAGHICKDMKRKRDILAEKIRKALLDNQFSAKQLASRFLNTDDTKSQTIVRSIIETLDNVEVISAKSPVKYTIRASYQPEFQFDQSTNEK